MLKKMVSIPQAEYEALLKAAAHSSESLLPSASMFDSLKFSYESMERELNFSKQLLAIHDHMLIATSSKELAKVLASHYISSCVMYDVQPGATRIKAVDSLGKNKNISSFQEFKQPRSNALERFLAQAAVLEAPEVLFHEMPSGKTALYIVDTQPNTHQKQIFEIVTGFPIHDVQDFYPYIFQMVRSAFARKKELDNPHTIDNYQSDFSQKIKELNHAFSLSNYSNTQDLKYLAMQKVQEITGAKRVALYKHEKRLGEEANNANSIVCEAQIDFITVFKGETVFDPAGVKFVYLAESANKNRKLFLNGDEHREKKHYEWLSDDVLLFHKRSSFSNNDPLEQQIYYQFDQDKTKRYPGMNVEEIAFVKLFENEDYHFFIMLANFDEEGTPLFAESERSFILFKLQLLLNHFYHRYTELTYKAHLDTMSDDYREAIIRNFSDRFHTIGNLSSTFGNSLNRMYKALTHISELQLKTLYEHMAWLETYMPDRADANIAQKIIHMKEQYTDLIRAHENILQIVPQVDSQFSNNYPHYRSRELMPVNEEVVKSTVVDNTTYRLKRTKSNMLVFEKYNPYIQTQYDISINSKINKDASISYEVIKDDAFDVTHDNFSIKINGSLQFENRIQMAGLSQEDERICLDLFTQLMLDFLPRQFAHQTTAILTTKEETSKLIVDLIRNKDNLLPQDTKSVNHDVFEVINRVIDKLDKTNKGISINIINSIADFDTKILLLSCRTDDIMALFQNILSNAIKYTSHYRHSDITIHLHLSADTKTHITTKYVLSIDIIDDGYGMTPERLEEVRKAIASGKRVTPDTINPNKRSESSGYGYEIISKALKEMRGNISIDSLLHQGTTVHIELPVEVEQRG